MKRKKFLILIFVIYIMFYLCSCANLRAIQLTNLTNEESQKIRPMSEEIIRCLTEKDKEAFKKLFCEKTKSSDSFNTQIDQIFDFFICDTYIDSEIDTSASGGQSMEKGERVSWNVAPEIKYIKVIIVPDGDYEKMYERYYRISYYWQIINKGDTSLEGLQRLTVELLNMDSKATVGESYS